MKEKKRQCQCYEGRNNYRILVAGVYPPRYSTLGPFIRATDIEFKMT